MSIAGLAPAHAAIFDALAVIMLAMLTWACVQRMRIRYTATRDRDDHAARKLTFLLIWIALEAIAAVAISPFAAARRVMGLSIALTVLAAKLVNDVADAPAVRATNEAQPPDVVHA